MKQTSFWEKDDPPPDKALIKILTPETNSKETKNFQKKVLKIENLQKSNKTLKCRLEDIRQQLAKILTPLSDRFCDLRVTSLENLDKQIQGTYFRTNEKKKITALILEGASELVGMYHDERGKPFYDKYSDISLDDQKTALMEGMTSLFEEIFGPEDFEDDADLLSPTKQKKPRKTKTKAELHEETIQQESKSIYRSLMKTLHPDFEQDEEKKKEKTEVAQQISIAYNENNVYELLKLRSEHLDEGISEDDLKLYTTELNKRIRELEHEKYIIKNQYMDISNNFYSPNPSVTAKRIYKEQEKLEYQIQVEHNHANIFSDSKKLRRFLKDHIRLETKRPSSFVPNLMDDDAFGDDFW